MSRNYELMQQANLSLPVDHGAARTGHETAAAVAPSRVSAKAGSDDVAREEVLKLVQRLFLADSEHPLRIVVFSGIDAGSGCSHICSLAAEILATTSKGNVCLVDANLRTPSLPEVFGVSNHYGLTDSLRSTGPIREFAKPLQPDNLWLLSAGSLGADAAGMLGTDAMKLRLKELRQQFDYILIDSSPLNTFADAFALGKMADGLVLVLESNTTRRESALRVAERLCAAQVQVLGAVLNNRTYPIPESVYRRI